MLNAKLKIMSADDEPLNQGIIEEILTEEYMVTCFSNGQECLSQLANTQRF